MILKRREMLDMIDVMNAKPIERDIENIIMEQNISKYPEKKISIPLKRIYINDWRCVR